MRCLFIGREFEENMKKLFFLLVFLAAVPIYFAQQPQTSTYPIYAVNSQFTNGVAPGYWPTKGAGLVLNLSAGTAYCANAIVTYAGGTLTLTNNTTNYVYLNAASSCAPAFNTSGFTATTIPVATVVTASGAITTITDDRTHFFSPTAAGVGTVTSIATTSPITGGTITGTGTIACATCLTSAAGGGAIRSFGTTFGDTGGSALTAGSVVYFTVPYACTISAWNIAVDAGTVTFDIWKIASGSAVPTVSNAITASAKPALSSGTALHSTSMSGWTTSVTANDIFGIQLNTVATAKFAELDIQCNQ
jgi:hypothetical protein